MQILATEDLQTPGFGQRPARRGPAYGLGDVQMAKEQEESGSKAWYEKEKEIGRYEV